jgi:hypothetical protein
MKLEFGVCSSVLKIEPGESKIFSEPIQFAAKTPCFPAIFLGTYFLRIAEMLLHS